MPATRAAAPVRTLPVTVLMAVVTTVLMAVLLTGCGASDPAADADGPATTAAVDAGVGWADDVCSASLALQESLQGAGDAAEVDPTGSGTSLEQVRTQARERVTAVQQAAAALASALADVPAGADPDLAAAQQELESASAQAQEAVGELEVVVAEVSDAETAAEARVALGGLRAALTGTLEDLGGYLQTLGVTVDDGAQAVQDAFGSAPACAGLTG